ncbi:hypothetical protein QBC34DRAFT_381334 [Podospora aff. communis PSN243]|uniref:Infection structure specific protein n=1 Tax=Podospora aff. communis PSN243 TaxID=3040156 RepID=A0AAV9GJS7_9PEZI|nr:hypothetical protein QBC34DRAFT_381334 [Podospora aff. communis PSN243]
MHSKTLLFFIPGLAAAQTASSCLAAIDSLVSAFPTVPDSLVGLTDEAPITDPCNYTPPATKASAFSSFQSAVVSWAGENLPKVNSVVAACPELSKSVDGIEERWGLDLIVCSTDLQSATGTGAGAGAGATPSETTTTGGSASTTGTGTGPGTTGGAGAQSTTSTGAGARETGFVAGVAAVLGAVGAVVAL